MSSYIPSTSSIQSWFKNLLPNQTLPVVLMPLIKKEEINSNWKVAGKKEKKKNERILWR
jgi:hypothetical protein